MKIKLIILITLINILSSCTKPISKNLVLSPIENISYLFDLFLEEKTNSIISHDSIFRLYNLSYPKDSLVSEKEFYKYILNNCLDNRFGNYIKITNPKLYKLFITKNFNDIILDKYLELVYQKNATDELLFLVNNQNFLSMESIAEFARKNMDTLIYNLKNEELLKKYEVYQLEKPLFLIEDNKVIAEPQQIKINYSNKTIKIVP